MSEALIKDLHLTSMNKLLDDAGLYRKVAVSLSNSPHIPPNWIEVSALMGSMCDYVNQEWERRDLIFLSAFVLWRLNWIHPFRNGNGRTARSASYLVLSAKYGKLLPPKNTVIEQLVMAKPMHDHLLRQADIAYTTTQNAHESLIL